MDFKEQLNYPTTGSVEEERMTSNAESFIDMEQQVLEEQFYPYVHLQEEETDVAFARQRHDLGSSVEENNAQLIENKVSMEGEHQKLNSNAKQGSEKVYIKSEAPEEFDIKEEPLDFTNEERHEEQANVSPSQLAANAATLRSIMNNPGGLEAEVMNQLSRLFQNSYNSYSSVLTAYMLMTGRQFGGGGLFNYNNIVPPPPPLKKHYGGGEALARKNYASSQAKPPPPPPLKKQGRGGLLSSSMSVVRPTLPTEPVSSPLPLLVNSDNLSHEKIGSVDNFELSPNYQFISNKNHKAKTYKCQFCSYTTGSHRYLRKHSVTHSTEKTFKCTLCSYSAVCKRYLRKHLIRHKNAKQTYKCDFCDFSCISREYLREHFANGCASTSLISKDPGDDTESEGTRSKEEEVQSVEEEEDCKIVEDSKEIPLPIKTFKCSFCSYSSTCKQNLKKHVVIHRGEKLFKCSLCNYSGICKRYLTRHMMRHSKAKQTFKCNACNFTCINRESFREHVNGQCSEASDAIDAAKFSDSLPEVKTEDQDDKLDDDDKTFKCDKCDYSAVCRRYLRKHMVTHKTEKLYKCSLCNYSGVCRRYLRRHMLRHAGSNFKQSYYKCNSCGTKCTSMESLLGHLNIGCAAEPIDMETLKLNELNYYNIVTVEQRIEDLNSKEPKTPYKCELCDFTTERKRNMRKHLVTHKREKSFKCELCDYSAVCKRYLKKHLLRHNTTNQTFTCDMCDFTCARRDSIREHVKRHTGEKPHKCTVCDYKARNRSNLKVHMRKHTGEKPFECHLCEYKATQRSALATHLRSHSGERPFKCHLCDYTAVYGHSLKVHIRSHTGERPFKCDKCSYSAVQKPSLKIHMKTHERKAAAGM